jgi:hypothetical protein
MQYTKPELVLLGQAETLVQHSPGPHPGDPGPASTTSHNASLEFED